MAQRRPSLCHNAEPLAPRHQTSNHRRLFAILLASAILFLPALAQLTDDLKSSDPECDAAANDVIEELEGAVHDLRQQLAEQSAVIAALTRPGADRQPTPAQQGSGGQSQPVATVTPATSATTRKPSLCPAGFDYLPLARGCYRVVLEALNWQQSQARCVRLDPRARLAAVTNELQDLTIIDHLMKISNADALPCRLARDVGYSFYTAGQRNDTNNCGSQFVWKKNNGTSVPLTHTNWATGQPNCHRWSEGPESCLHYWSKTNYQWNDKTCAFTGCPICQLDLN